MKIVNRAAFLSLPAGTLFAKFDPHVFGELKIKEETVGADFIYQDLIPMPEDCHDSGDWFASLERMMAGEESAPLDYQGTMRDGLFDADQLFAVFNADDVDRLIARLQQAKQEAMESCRQSAMDGGTASTSGRST